MFHYRAFAVFPVTRMTMVKSKIYHSAIHLDPYQRAALHYLRTRDHFLSARNLNVINIIHAVRLFRICGGTFIWEYAYARRLTDYSRSIPPLYSTVDIRRVISATRNSRFLKIYTLAVFYSPGQITSGSPR